MAFFSSKRVRRYWFYTLAIVAAIYLTLGLAPELTLILREQDLLEASFAAGIVLVVATIDSIGDIPILHIKPSSRRLVPWRITPASVPIAESTMSIR